MGATRVSEVRCASPLTSWGNSLSPIRADKRVCAGYPAVAGGVVPLAVETPAARTAYDLNLRRDLRGVNLSSKNGNEGRKISIRPDATERLLGFEKPRRDPTLDHVLALPVLHVARV